MKHDLASFDAPFFNISPEEASAMDPQQRNLLEISYHAFENGGYIVDTDKNFLTCIPAGIPLTSIAGSRTAVFTGSFADDHKIQSLKDPEKLSKYTGTGTSFSILANRLSWWFDLHGPSMNIDTACSSSLVALHLASQSLRSRESSMASIAAIIQLSQAARARHR